MNDLKGDFELGFLIGRDKMINDLHDYFKYTMQDASLHWHGFSGVEAFDKIIEQLCKGGRS